MAHLNYLARLGLEASLLGEDELLAGPPEVLDEPPAGFIRDHKREIIAEVLDRAAGVDRRPPECLFRQACAVLGRCGPPDTLGRCDDTG